MRTIVFGAATTEMRAIDEDFMALVETLPGRRMPTWDALRAEMPGWDELEARWNRKANEEAPRICLGGIPLAFVLGGLFWLGAHLL